MVVGRWISKKKSAATDVEIIHMMPARGVGGGESMGVLAPRAGEEIGELKACPVKSVKAPKAPSRTPEKRSEMDFFALMAWR